MSKLVNLNEMNLVTPSLNTNYSLLSKFNMNGGGLNTKIILYILAFVLFMLLAIYLYKKYVSPRFNPSYKPNREILDKDNSNMTQKEAEIIMFYVDWCPHCKTSKPIWEKIKEKYENQNINGYRLLFKEINCTKENDDEVVSMLNKYNIEGYPTIKMIKDNQVIEYDAKLSEDTMTQFLNTVL